MPTLSVGAINVSYRTCDMHGNAGGLRPLLLFIHGAGTASHRWRFQVQSLGRSYFSFAVDLPWHGGSDGLKSWPAFTGYADFLEALWLEIRNRWRNIPGLVVIGEQMGAAIALEFAQRRPHRLSGLVLVSSASKMVIPREWLSVLRQGIVPMEMVVQTYHPLPYKYWGREHSLDVAHCSAEIRYLDHLVLNSFEQKEKLDAVNVPTLILAGSDDALLEKDSVLSLQQSIRGADLEIIQGAGHALPVQKSREVGLAIHRFISNHIWRASSETRIHT